MAHLIDLPDWAVERGRALNSFTAIDASRTALVNIDMQTVFMAEGQIYANRHARDIVGIVNALSRTLRRAGGTVIWTRQTHVAEGPFAPPSWQYDMSRPDVRAGVAALQAHTPGHALYPEMETAPDDLVIDKYRYGALSCPAGALGRALAALSARW